MCWASVHSGARGARAKRVSPAMKSFFALLFIVELSSGLSLQLDHVRAGLGRSLENDAEAKAEALLASAKDAEKMGELYNSEAGKMPMEEESAKAVRADQKPHAFADIPQALAKALLLEKAESIGSVDEEIASELSAGVAAEQGECAECAREFSGKPVLAR